MKNRTYIAIVGVIVVVAIVFISLWAAGVFKAKSATTVSGSSSPFGPGGIRKHELGPSGQKHEFGPGGTASGIPERIAGYSVTGSMYLYGGGNGKVVVNFTSEPSYTAPDDINIDVYFNPNLNIGPHSVRIAKGAHVSGQLEYPFSNSTVTTGNQNDMFVTLNALSSVINDTATTMLTPVMLKNA